MKEEFNRNIKQLLDLTTDLNIQSNFLGHMTSEDMSDYIEEFCWCEKIGEKIRLYGQCCDRTLDERKRRKRIKKKRSCKRERNKKYKQYLKSLYENDVREPQPVEFVKEIHIKGYGNINISKQYYRRLYRGRLSSYYKKISNRRIRQYKKEVSNGQWCHRLYNFRRKVN